MIELGKAWPNGLATALFLALVSCNQSMDGLTPTTNPPTALPTLVPSTLPPEATSSGWSPTSTPPSLLLEIPSLPEGIRQSQFLVSVRTNGDSDLYSIDLTSETISKAVESTGQDMSPSWNPIGNEITYLKSNQEGMWELWLYEPMTFASRALSTIDWSVGQLGRLSLASEETLKLDPATPSDIEWYSWSPKGDGIAYYGTNNLNNDLVLTRTDDIAPLALLSGTLVAGTAISWNTDGESILIDAGVDTLGSIRHLYLVGLVDHQIMDLDIPSHSTTLPAWRPNSEEFAYVSLAGPGVSDEQVYLTEIGQIVPRRVTNGDSIKVWLDWSPDGKRIAYGAVVLGEGGRLSQSGIYAIVPDTGQECVVAEGIGVDPRYFHWSHDGNFISYLLDDGPNINLVVTEVCGTGRWEIAKGIASDDFDWRPLP